MKPRPSPPRLSYRLVWTTMLASSLSLLAGCGGSSSETPWPKEPPGRHVGPAGEALPGGNVVDVKTLPVDKRYKKSTTGNEADPASP